MDHDTLWMIILAPIFIFGIQKYIEIRASYRPPTLTEIDRLERKYGSIQLFIVKNITFLRHFILCFAIIDAYAFGLSIESQLKWAFVGGMIPCIVVMSILGRGLIMP